MAWTEAETKRIQAIEEMINRIQVAVNNLATKAQLNSALHIRQSEIEELKTRVTSLEQQILLLQS